MADEQGEEALLAEAEAALSGASPVVVAAPVVQPPVVAAEPVVTPPVVETPPTGQEPIPATGEEDEAFFRGRLHGPDAVFAQLVKQGIPAQEAYSRAYAPPVVETPVEAAPDPEVSVLEQNEANEKILAAHGTDNALITPEFLAAIDKKIELRDQLRDIRQQKAATQAEQAQAATQTWSQQWDASEAEAKKSFAEASDPNSPLSLAVDAELASIKEGHPLFGNPELPELIYAKQAARLGIVPQKRTAATPPPQRLQPASGALRTAPLPVNNPATQQAAMTQRYQAAIAAGDDDALADLAEEELSGAAPSRHSVMTFG